MYQLSDLYKKYLFDDHLCTVGERLVLTGLGALIFLLIGFGYGPVITPDGVVLMELAEVLQAAPFGSTEFSAKLSEINVHHPIEQPITFYLIYLYILAALEAAFGGQWVSAHMIVNVVALVGMLFALLMLASTLFEKRIFVILTWGALVGCWEFLQWGGMTQSEPIFYLVSIISFALIYRGLSSVVPSKRFRLIGAGLLIALFSIFLRPSGIPLALFSTAVSVGALSHHYLFGETPEYAIRRISAAIFLALLAGVPIAALILMDPSLLPEALELKFLEYHDQASRGVVINSRPETYLTPGSDYTHYLVLILVRMAAYFDFVARDFSRAHNIINVIYFVPFYFLALVGGIFALSQTKNPPRTEIDFIFLATVYVMLFAAFHASTLVDFDWRYRSPVHPIMILFAVAGLRSFVPIGQALQNFRR